MEEIKWRFPSNGNGQEIGLSDSNSEMFKEDPSAALAREIVQNSIDARLDDQQPVRVEFECFDVDRNKIPNIEQAEKQIISAIKTWDGFNEELVDQLNDMLISIQQPTLRCCRISDFNTTGLIGVGTEHEHKDHEWHDLIFGSGISNKSATSGGSKGVGKNATYVNSEFGMVFYSTLTVDGAEGYIGLLKTCSAEIDGNEDGEKTLDLGYYGSDHRQSSIPGQFNLEENYTRIVSGTDVYIIGFADKKGWENEVIYKLLDSFMVAIMYGKLVLKINGRDINKDTVSEYVFDQSIIDPKRNWGKNIIMQYYLLTECTAPYEFIAYDDSKVKLYFLDCGENYKDAVTSKSFCTMVRYPYMKIKEEPLGIGFPFGALCVIENNDLNKRLRKVENPQHTAWEFNRLKKKSDLNDDLQDVYTDVITTISSYVWKQLYSTNLRKTDFIGAGEFIPQNNKPNGKSDTQSTKKTSKINAKPSISKQNIKLIDVNEYAQFEDPLGNGVLIDFGGNDTADLEESITPFGHNNGSGGPTKVGKEPNKVSANGDKNQIFKKAEIRGMKYRFVCIDKAKGRFAIKVCPDISVNNASLELFQVDENYLCEPVTIYSAEIDGSALNVSSDGTSVSLNLIKGKDTTIFVNTNKNELFSAEVRLYENRQ